MLGFATATYRNRLNRNGLTVKIFRDKDLWLRWRLSVDFQLRASSFELPVSSFQCRA